MSIVSAKFEGGWRANVRIVTKRETDWTIEETSFDYTGVVAEKVGDLLKVGFGGKTYTASFSSIGL